MIDYGLNWRLQIKEIFACLVADALDTDLMKYEGWNIQTDKDSETFDQVAIFFQFRNVSIGEEYTHSHRSDSSEYVVTTCTLHILFNDYSDEAQNKAYDYAHKINSGS